MELEWRLFVRLSIVVHTDLLAYDSNSKYVYTSKGNLLKLFSSMILHLSTFLITVTTIPPSLSHCFALSAPLFTQLVNFITRICQDYENIFITPTWHWALAEKSINHNPLWATVLRFAAARIPSIWFRWLLWRIKMILIIVEREKCRLKNGERHSIHFDSEATSIEATLASRILHIFPSSSSSHHLS